MPKESREKKGYVTGSATSNSWRSHSELLKIDDELPDDQEGGGTVLLDCEATGPVFALELARRLRPFDLVVLLAPFHRYILPLRQGIQNSVPGDGVDGRNWGTDTQGGSARNAPSRAIKNAVQRGV